MAKSAWDFIDDYDKEDEDEKLFTPEQTELGESAFGESRYGYESLPQTKGVWVRFEAVDFESISEQEANVTCQSFGYDMESPTVKYRMQIVDGQWTAIGIAGVGEEKILQ